MDRVDFTKSIISEESIEDLIKNYFNETMALYNIVGEYDKRINIIHTHTNNIASFSITFKTKKEAKELYNVISGAKINIYDSIYKVHSDLAEKIINITLYEIL